MKKFIVIIPLFLSLIITAQDTLNILQYNLMYYGLNDVGCNSDNNNIDTKNNYLKAIIDYVKPDIFTVNEINADENTQDYLLNNVFIENGYPQFKRAQTSGSYLNQQIFYNASKIRLASTEFIQANPRYINAYKFYYLSNELSQGDTVYFICFVAHLKAGSDASNAKKRATATANLMNYISKHPDKNYFFMGDFNLYSNTETAFQNVISPADSTIKLNDPVNQEGQWHNNSTYANVHTQSTHYYTGDCAVGGGLDDRFDYILVSNSILSGTDKIEYLAGSYQSIGNDGKHFNNAINYQGNSSVPANVLEALANNSDHLPVNAKFIINQNPTKIKLNNNPISKIEINNPAANKLFLTLFSNSLINKTLYLNIYNTNGQKISTKKIQTYAEELEYSISVNNLTQGIYFLNITDNNQISINKKFIKE